MTMMLCPVLCCLVKVLGIVRFRDQLEDNTTKRLCVGQDKGGVRRQQGLGVFCTISGELFVLDVLLGFFALSFTALFHSQEE